MTDLSDSDRKAYEQYLLATTDDQRQEAIKKLIPGSYLYYHLYFLDKFKQKGANLDDTDKKMLDQFCQKYPHNEYLTQVNYRHLLLRYDKAETSKEKEEIIDEIKSKILYLSFEHYKPEEFRGEDSRSQSSQSEDEGDEGSAFADGKPQKKGHSFDYDKYFSKAKVLEKLKPGIKNDDQSNQKIQDIPQVFDQEIDFTWYTPQAVYNNFALGVGRDRVSDLWNETFYQQLKAYFEEQYEKQKKQKHGYTFTIDRSFLQNLTLKQLDKLSSLHPEVKEDKNFMGSYFQKVFSEELAEENQEVKNNDEKRANLERLYQYAKNKDMPKSLQSSLLIEILQLGIKLDIFDEEYFKEYIQIPMVLQSHVFNEKKNHTRKANADSHWNEYIGNVQSQQARSGNWNDPQSELISKYLEHFCQKNGNLKAYEDDFSSKYLRQIEEKIAIYNSDDMTNLNVDLKKYKEVSKEVQLRFLDSNKEIFKVEEEVELKVELKNIETLYVKIFEFNTETYYKKTLQPFNTGVNLDGLIASTEKVFEYKHPSNKKFIETFTFEEFKGKVGLFIIEFIGNGMSSRAVIKKGSLSLIHKPTVAGHLAYVLDENKNICKGPKTGIWFEKEYYEAKDTGKIFIPYGKSQLSAKAILINNGFAQLSEFQRNTETYSFKAFIHIDLESLLVGNTAQVLVKPILAINGRQASVEMLKNSKVTITTQFHIDNIPVSKKFENLKFKNNQELVLDFQVPPYLQSITVNLESEVYNVTNKSNDKFSANQQFSVNVPSSNNQTAQLFLRKEQGEYNVYLLGKNGEPKPGVTVNIQMANPKYKFLREQGDAYSTDKEGRVKLGNIHGVIGVMASANLFGIDNHWFFSNKRENIQYPDTIEVIEGEDLEIPVLFKKLSRKHISIIKSNNGNVLEDLFDEIKFTPAGDSSFYSKVKLTNIQVGQYTLKLKNIGKEIDLTIHKGQYWENDTFILKSNSLFENKTAQRMIKIQNIKLEESKQANSTDVSIQLEDHSSNTRVHVFAVQFLPQISVALFHKYKKLLESDFHKTIFPFAQWKNIFMNNRELSDEYRYVFDRKYAERVIGNQLERPKLVLKRHFIQATQMDQERLKQGNEYANEKSYDIQTQQQQPMARKTQAIQKKSMLMSRKENKRSSRNNYEGGSDEDIDNIAGSLATSSEAHQVHDFQNFLKNASYAIPNLAPSQDGLVKFTANLSQYTQLFVLAVDVNTVAQCAYDLPVNPIQKKDLTLAQAFDTNKGFTESRTAFVINKGDTHLIEDITSSQFQIVDDLTKVQSVMDELIRSQHMGTSEVYKDLAFITKWTTYTEDEKNKKYSKYSCNELNIFLYFKDKEYFNKVVKPYLECKMEKIFIDHYLLGNYAAIQKYVSLKFIDKINALEQCLLVDALVKLGKQEDAKRVAEYIKMKSEATENKDKNLYNNIFDTVLNLNSLKGEDSGDHSGEKESRRRHRTGMAQTAAAHPQMYNQFAQMRQVEQHYGGGGMECMMMEDEAEYQNECLSYAPQSNMRGRGGFRSLNRVQKRAYRAGSMDDDCDECEEEGGDSDYGSEIKEERKKAKINFEEIEKTNEYMETHYYKEQVDYNTAYLIFANLFWSDYAQFLTRVNPSENDKFVNASFLQNYSNHRSALLCLAVLDLPFEAQRHSYQTNDRRGLNITASDNLILFQKEVKEAPVDVKNDILVTHRYMRTQLTYEQQQTAEAIPDEFLANQTYECEVIMTNVSPQKKDFSILYQIPQGSLPLLQTKYMKSQQTELQPYTTNRQKFYFYFPKEGTFTHFPSNIAIDEKVVARANANDLKVVKQLSVAKKETFRDIVQNGNKEDILEFLRTANLAKYEKGYNSSEILWMLKDKQFFLQVIEVFRSRLLFDNQIWTYAFYHKDDQSMKEYLTTLDTSLTVQLGTFFDSSLVTVQPQDNGFKHLDYFPMVNARIHQIGETAQWSLNKTFLNTYNKFLQAMIQAKDFNEEYRLNLVYYMILQDRVQEAINLFKTIDLSTVYQDSTLQIQYDYMSAYFDFFTGVDDGFKVARSIVRKYEYYPIESWRLMFLEILDQLNEFDGEIDEESEIQDQENQSEEQKKKNQKKQVKKEPTINCEISEVGRITIETTNVKSITLKFYIIDAEILFSRTPFLKENTEEFSYVKPRKVIEQELMTGQEHGSLNHNKTVDIEIPDELKNKNLVVEFNGANKQIFKTYYSTQLKVALVETFGELKVTDKDNKPLAKVYVKVFSQKKGQSTNQAVFFKDGYTDIRGKFDYAQTSGSKLKEVQKFAILINSDELGSVIKEVDPPKVDESASVGGADIVISQSKVDRLMNRWDQVNKKKSK